MFGKLGPVCSTPSHIRTEEVSVVRHTQNLAILLVVKRMSLTTKGSLVSEPELAATVAKDRRGASPEALERYSSAYVWNRRVRR